METKIKAALKLYNDIDQATQLHYKSHKKQPPCKKGCSSCCSQFFEISEVEYAIIEKELLQLSPDKQRKLQIKAQVLMDIFKNNWSSFYNEYFTDDTLAIHTQAYYKNPDRFNINMPCIFLSDEGGCEIYESRPIVCRTTGVSFLHLFNKDAICSVMPVSLFTPLWQADLRRFKDDINAIRWLEDDSPMSIKRQYPMFFYVYKRFNT